MSSEDIGNPRHHSQSVTQRNKWRKRNQETKVPLPLFESVEQTTCKGSFLLDTSLRVSASSANAMKLLKKVGESALKTIPI